MPRAVMHQQVRTPPPQSEGGAAGQLFLSETRTTCKMPRNILNAQNLYQHAFIGPIVVNVTRAVVALTQHISR